MYVDFTFYSGTYMGDLLTESSANGLLQRASDNIDSMTFNRIVAMGFDRLTLFQQTNLKKAVCAQADFLFGDGDSSLENAKSPKSFTLSKMQIDFGGVSLENAQTCRRTLQYLRPTGLMVRSMG